MTNDRYENYSEEMKQRLYASELYKDFFDDCYGVIYGKSLEELERAYLDKCIGYLDYYHLEYDEKNPNEMKRLFETHDGIIYDKDTGHFSDYNDYIRDDRRDKEVDGYYLLKKELKKEVKCYESQSEVTRPLLISYNHLINTINVYGFYERTSKSYGGRQNTANKAVLLQLSTLKPVLLMISDNVNNHFDNHLGETKINDENILKEKLEDLKNNLDIATNTTEKAGSKYFGYWHYLRGENMYYMSNYFARSISIYDLGKAGVDWKKERNNACHTILELYKELYKINSTLNQQTVIYSKEKIKEEYTKAIKNIINSPYYFCYLNDEEKKEMKTGKQLVKNKEKEFKI